MAMANSLRDYFDHHPLSFKTIKHKHSESATQNAAAAHLKGDSVAKSVLLKDEDNYLLAVLPATHRLDLGRLHQFLNRYIGLATEKETEQVFSDCELGAIPPTGLLYDIDTIVEEDLLSEPEIYFEAGDHEHLVHMKHHDFIKLMGDATRLHMSHRI